MNYVPPLVDVHIKNDLIEIENIMKKFKYVFHEDKAEIPGIFNIQAIMEEGRIDDLMKCIQSIINYNFNACTNNSVNIIDPLFLKFLHVAQLIIRFLLYWKSELHEDNIKLKNKCQQEIDKLRKKCFMKKLEINNLKNQLFRCQKSDDSKFRDTSISECTHCRKVFVNSTFLHAHYKRRHADQTFSNTEGLNELKFLEDEIRLLKYQFKKLSAKGNQSVLRLDTIKKYDEVSAMTLQMKLIPEQNCLEAQEKYWRGKLKEIGDQFADEKMKLKNLSEKIILENLNLKTEVANIRNSSRTCPVAVQTEISLLTQDISETRDTIILNQYETVGANIKNEPKLQQFTFIPTILNSEIENTNQNLSVTSTFIKNEFSSSDVISQADEKLVKTTLYDSNDFVSMNKNVGFISRDLFGDSFPTRTSDFSDEFPPSFLSVNLNKSSSRSCLNNQNEVEISCLRRDTTLRHEECDIVEEVESFLEDFDKRKVQIERKNRLCNVNSTNCKTHHSDVKNVISKLFTADTDSVELADKLIKIYEKRHSLVSENREVSDTVRGNDPFNTSNRAASIDIYGQNLDELLENDSSVSNEETTKCEENPGTSDDRVRKINRDCRTTEEIRNSLTSFKCNESNVTVTNKSVESPDINLLTNRKEKSKILPFFRNIPSRIIKNCTKSRKTCINMIENKLIRKLPPLGSQNATIMDKTVGAAEQESPLNRTMPNNKPLTHYTQQHDVQFDNLRNNVKCFPTMNGTDTSEDRTLVSALKKSKSTGNITKKVAFMENISTFKSGSETDLMKIPDFKPKHMEVPISETIALVHVCHDRFDCPVPVPRTKKNVILSRSGNNVLNGCAELISDIKENMN